MQKAIILVGGPQKGMFFISPIGEIIFFLGTRFRPLSLDMPKPLFPVAGLPIIQHHIEACAAVSVVKEILIIGYYPAAEFETFITEMIQEYKIIIRCVLPDKNNQITHKFIQVLARVHRPWYSRRDVPFSGPNS